MVKDGKDKSSELLRVIDSEAEYERRQIEFRALLESTPKHGSPAFERLRLIALLIERFETEKLGTPQVDPISAIEFRMEQMGMSPRDLEPYLGSRSKVSEILSGKRRLTREMAQALHEGLGIPASALLNPDQDHSVVEIDWSRFPATEMIRRGWVKRKKSALRTVQDYKEILEPYFASVSNFKLAPSLFRASPNIRAGRAPDTYALWAWTARVLEIASKEKVRQMTSSESWSDAWLKALVGLSVERDSFAIVKDYLREAGILLITEPHLPRTRLDGAALWSSNGWAVTGLTLRFDRVDSFWFTLLHEIAHLRLHFRQGARTSPRAWFFDDLEVYAERNSKEIEADNFARENLVPMDKWEASIAAYTPSPEAVEILANELRVHPAIIAGRAQYEFRNYRILKNLVGNGEVQSAFAAAKMWNALPEKR